MPKPTRTLFTVQLTPDRRDPAPAVTLKRALKVLLRSFGMRCLDLKCIDEAEQPPAPAAGEDESGAAKTNP